MEIPARRHTAKVPLMSDACSACWLTALQVTRAAIGNDCTLVCGWSNQECARYLETFKR